MDRNKHIQRILAHLSTVMGAETLRTTLNLDYPRMVDLASRILDENGPDIRSHEIDLCVYAMSQREDLKHLFGPLPNAEGEKRDQPTTPPLFGRDQAEFLNLPAQERLRIANEHAERAHADTAAANQLEADALAFASKPPGFESWSAERRLQHSNEAAALAAKQRAKKAA